MGDSPQEIFGRLQEAALFTGYAATRTKDWYDGLIEGDRWRELGFDEFDDFVRAVDLSMVGGSRAARLPIEQDMAERGAPLRAIAAALGVSPQTVMRDLKSVSDGTDDPNDQEPDQQEQDDGEDILFHGGTDETSEAEPERNSEPEPEPEPEPTSNPVPKPEPVMLTLRTHTGEEVSYPKPSSKATFNETTGDGISWAAWSWNPVTGCLHGCDYCYARAIAHRFTEGFPAGFTPLFHHERLDAPANTTVPQKHAGHPKPDCPAECESCAYKRVFVCSMADLYGRWVPDEWIEQVHASMLAAPWWQYILLTKFPARYVGLDLPPNAWVGTSVDEQKRVRIAEDAFRKIEGVKVKWLSLEPLREPLEFSDLSMFDWVVIGAQTETRQPDGTVEAFMPPWEWVCRITAQAKEADCKVHWKPNLFNGKPGLPPNEYPGGA